MKFLSYLFPICLLFSSIFASEICNEVCSEEPLVEEAMRTETQLTPAQIQEILSTLTEDKKALFQNGLESIGNALKGLSENDDNYKALTEMLEDLGLKIDIILQVSASLVRKEMKNEICEEVCNEVSNNEECCSLEN